LEEKIVYYEKPGPANSETTLQLALERARARGIKKIVMASTRGDTARQAAKLLEGSGIRMVVVPHQYGFMSDKQHFPAELAEELAAQGHIVHFGTMLFHTERFYGEDIPTVMANLLRTFCQGMKVCVEIVFMTVDAGKVDVGEEVVVVTGTGRGADTAVVAIAAPSTRLTEFHITEIICKPLQTKSFAPPPPQMPPPPEKID
jgi:hypothetical protein